MIIRFIVGVLIAAAAFGSVVSHAVAEAPDYDDVVVVEGLLAEIMDARDPEAAFAALTPEAQDALEKFLTPSSVERRVEIIPGADDDNLFDHFYECATQRGEDVLEGNLGYPLAKYRSRTYFCYDGQEVLSADVTTGWWVLPPWSFKGDVYVRESWGPHNHWHIDRAQGKFEACFIICRTWYSTINKKQWNTGSSEEW